tara:strand:- start:64 stop:315 length:252 start_codon:yes stop_codon:yes gene_type:complete
MVKAWQARSVLVGRGLEGKVTQARCVKEARRKVMQGELRSGRRGGTRHGSPWHEAEGYGVAGLEREVGVVRLGQDRHGNAGTV